MRYGVLLLALATGVAVAQEGAMERIFPYETHVEQLDNGLKVIVVPMSSGGLVAYWTVVRTGSRDEYEAGRTGFAHFFEHMMFRGTEQYSAERYNELLTEIGADTNAYTTDDLTAYHLGIAGEDLELVMELESDRFRNLAYSEGDFETEAGAVYGEYRKNRMNPIFAIYEAVYQRAFDKHSYGHTTMGYEQDIKAMPGMYDYSRSFFSRYYRPDNVVLLIVGEVDPGSTLELARRHYGEWEPGYVQPRIPAEPEQKASRRVEVRYDGKSLPVAWVAYKGAGFDPRSKPVLAGRLLAELAFGSTSEIHKKLVLEEQVVEFIQADLGMNRDPNLFDIYTRIKNPGKIDYVLEQIDEVVRQAREVPPDPQRLADLKSRLKYQFLMRLDTPDRVASSLARIIAVTGGIEAVDTMYRVYDTVGPEDVREAARQFFDERRRTVAVLKGEG